MDKDKRELYPKIKVYLRPDRVTGSVERDLSRDYGAEVVNYSVELDLALLKMSGVLPGLNAIEFADPEEILVGEEVVAIGHPEQGRLLVSYVREDKRRDRGFSGRRGKRRFPDRYERQQGQFRRSASRQAWLYGGDKFQHSEAR